MKYFAALTMVVLIAPANCVAAAAPPALLLARLASLAGSKSRDCGAVSLHEESGGAMKCAKDASAAGTPYRVSFQLESPDSVIWQGAAQDDNGKVWMLFYDADSKDGADSSPTFSVLRCKAMRFIARGGEFLDCEPMSGER